MGNSYIPVPKFSTTVAVNGTNRGVVQLTSITGLFVGMEGWLSGTALTPMYIKVIKINTSTKDVWVRQIPVPPGGSSSYPQPNYGYTSVTAFTVAAASRLSCPAQVVEVWPAYTAPTNDQS